MPTKSAKSPEAFAYFPASLERRSLSPAEVKRPRWKPRHKVRSLGAEYTSGDEVVVVWLEHRSHPELVFRLELDGAGQLVGFGVRPLAFIGEYTPDGEPVVVGAEVDPEGLPEGAPRITATLMRDVPLGALHTAAVEHAAKLRAVGVKVPEHRKRYRSDAVPDQDLAAFARAYLAACEGGVQGPLKVTAKRFGYSEGGGRERLRSARSRGIYVGLGQGKAGGHLTPKGRALLEGF